MMKNVLIALNFYDMTQVYLSYLEIYNEQIRDLLSPSPGVHLELREDREQVHVAGLSEVRATSTNEVGILFSLYVYLTIKMLA